MVLSKMSPHDGTPHWLCSGKYFNPYLANFRSSDYNDFNCSIRITKMFELYNVQPSELAVVSIIVDIP